MDPWLDEAAVHRARSRARLYLYLAFVSQVGVSALVILFALEYLQPFVGGVPSGRYVVIGITVSALLYAWLAALAPARRGQYRRAIVPSLLLGLSGIPFGLVVVGVFYILGYLQLRNVDEDLERAPPPRGHSGPP